MPAVACALVFAACWLLMTALPALSQIDRGTIEGLVADPTGAVVPDAKVQVINNATNSAIALASNAQGLYTAANLPNGTYRVVVTKQGFNTVTRAQVVVLPSVTVRVDFALTPGQVTQSVEVTGAAPLLDVGTTNNSTGMDSNLIESIPLIDAGTQRAITDYLTSLPGYTGSSSFAPTANGAPEGDTEVFIDGGPASEWGISRGALAEVSPMIEQVQQVSVVENAFNAEYGGFGNWFTNVTIKSGTNNLHGSFFDHLGNSVLNAKSYFQTGVTPFRQNEGGFTLGGPVVIPRLYNGRNRTFFFASLGLFFSRQGAGGGLITVPTARECAGDFSQIGQPIYDPATTQSDGKGGLVRQQFSYNGQLNVIAPDRITSAAKLICSKYIPTPSYPNQVNNNYISQGAPNWPYFNTWTPLIKVDHSFSDTEKLSVSYTDQIRHRLLSGNGYALTPPPAWGGVTSNPLDDWFDQIANSWKVRINLDSVITPQILNHVTLSGDRYINLGPNGTDGQGWDQKLGITGIPDDNGAFPAMSFSGGTGAPSTWGRSYEEDWHEMRYTVDENLSWTHNRHNFKFGFEIGMNQENRFIKPRMAGAFTFSNTTTTQPDAANASVMGSAFASFLLGAVNQTSAYIPIDVGLRFMHYGYFAQDDWHITPKLTISYGLRWDYAPPGEPGHNYQTAFQADILNPNAANLHGALAYAATYGKPFQTKFRGGFAPRLGVAYQLDKKTMVRASTGLYYAATGNLVPFLDSGAAGYSASPSFSSPDGYTPVMYIDRDSFPQNFEKPPAIDPSFLNGQAIQWIPKNGDRLPQTLNWVVDVERELTPTLSLDVTYIGSHSTHLPLSGTPTELNYVPAKYLSMGFGLLAPCAAVPSCRQPFPGFNSQLGANTVAQTLKPFPQYTLIDTDSVLLPEGKAHYNSLQIKATKRTSYGLSGLAFFTWMKNITNDAGTPGDTTYASSFGATEQYPGENPEVIDPGTPAATFGASWAYLLPFGKGRLFMAKAPAAVDYAFGGWSLSGTVRYSSGSALQMDAINPFAGAFGYSSLAPFEYANYAGGNPHAHWSGNPYKDHFLNPAAFSSPPLFTFGNTSQYLSWARGFTQGSEALEIGKTIPLHEAWNFDISADFVNPFNITRWANPSTLVGIPTFGTVSAIQGTPRAIQINGKIRF